MTRTACLVCLFSTVSGYHKNAIGKGSSAGIVHITKLEQSRFSLEWLYLKTSAYTFQLQD